MRGKVSLRCALVSLSLVGASHGLQALPDVGFWAVRDTGTISHLRGVTYGAQKFIVAGDGGTILVSTNLGWERIESGSTNDLTGVAWANGTFVIVGAAGTVLTSPDGITWTRRDSGVDDGIRCVTFGNDSFLALGSTNSLMSKNGSSWSRYPFPLNGPYQFPPMGPEAVCYGNGRFVSVGVWEIRESPDGQTWRLWPQTLYLYHDILFAGGNFTAIGEGEPQKLGIRNPYLWRAPGVVEQGGPTMFSDINVGTLRAIASGDGMFVAVGGTRIPPFQLPIGKIFSSPTGDNPWSTQDRFIDPWPETYFQLQNVLLDVAYGAGKFVAVGEGGILVESGNAVRFDPRLIRIQSDGQLQFAVLSPVGSHVQIDTTADFQTWSKLLTATNSTGTFTFQVAPLPNNRFLRATLPPP